MRYSLRSMTVMALCACLSMMVAPLFAVAVPIDPGLRAVEKSYPASVVVDVAQVAIVSDLPAFPTAAVRLSQQAAIVMPVVVVPVVQPASPNLIRPHLRC